MATATDLITDATIRAAAITAGYADAMVTRYTDWRPYHIYGEPEIAEQRWYVLSVKRAANAAFEVAGQRRTKVELLGLIENLSR